MPNYLRNNFIAKKGLPRPRATSTGTIVGCMFSGGIILGTSAPAEEGREKIQYITDSIRCCGADTDFTASLISTSMVLQALSTGSKPRVVNAMTLLKQMLLPYQGQSGAALVLGGVDDTGPHLFSIAPHGSTNNLPYVTMGSGSLAATVIFESGWKPNMSRNDALSLVTNAISGGTQGSGSNVDELARAEGAPVRPGLSPGDDRVEDGARIRILVVSEEITMVGGGDEMDTS